MVKKSISVTEQQAVWINAQIETGRYGNESEVVRDLIRERQIRGRQRPAEIKAVHHVSEPEPLPYTVPITAEDGGAAGADSLVALNQLQTSLQERNIDLARWERDVKAERLVLFQPDIAMFSGSGSG